MGGPCCGTACDPVAGPVGDSACGPVGGTCCSTACGPVAGPVGDCGPAGGSCTACGPTRGDGLGTNCGTGIPTDTGKRAAGLPVGSDTAPSESTCGPVGGLCHITGSDAARGDELADDPDPTIEKYAH